MPGELVVDLSDRLFKRACNKDVRTDRLTHLVDEIHEASTAQDNSLRPIFSDTSNASRCKFFNCPFSVASQLAG